MMPFIFYLNVEEMQHFEGKSVTVLAPIQHATPLRNPVNTTTALLFFARQVPLNDLQF